MAGTFSNPRLSAIPCERMRGALFAEDFVSEPRVEANAGVIAGVGYTVNRGMAFVGANSVSFDPVECPGDFSVVVKFDTEIQGDIYLFLDGTLTTGFWVRLTATGIECSHNDGVTTETIEHVCTYNDGTEKTVTYLVNKTEGTHSILFEEEDPTEGATAISGSTGGSSPVVAGASFTGTLYKARIYSAVLTQAEHDLIRTDTLTDFVGQALAIYRCDDVGNDTVGHKIWDRTVNVNDLYKADRIDAAAFPTFDLRKYEFDGVDDYVSNFPELTGDFTVSALAKPFLDVIPTVIQENDLTTVGLLEAAGGFHGDFQNMMLFEKLLSSLELLHAEYHQWYWENHGYALGEMSRLCTDGSAVLAIVPGKSVVDWASVYSAGSRVGVTQTDTGVTFDAAGSYIGFSDKAAGRITDGSIVFYGDFGVAAVGTLISKGAGYSFSVTATHLAFSGSTIAHVISAETQIGVTFRDGFPARFYVDGYFIGEGAGNVSTDDTDTSDVVLGNNTAKNSVCPFEIAHVVVGDEPITGAEVMALWRESIRMMDDTNTYPEGAGYGVSYGIGYM